MSVGVCWVWVLCAVFVLVLALSGVVAGLGLGGGGGGGGGGGCGGGGGGEDITKFLSEVVAVMQNVNPELVDLLYWDSNVASHEVYGVGDGDKLVASTKPKGGGGTSPSCITDYLKEKDIKPEACLVLTDGYVGNDWGGDWSCPVLWAIVGRCKAVPEKGSVIYID